LKKRRLWTYLRITTRNISLPQHDIFNKSHLDSIDIFDSLSYLPAVPLDQIKFDEVYHEWKKFRPKKSSDSIGTSAFILKKLPIEYLKIITILFNTCATNGSFFDAGKIAKTICLSKNGLYPTENKLRPISLLQVAHKQLCNKKFEYLHSVSIKWSNYFCQ
jgi:hypothetical protein